MRRGVRAVAMAFLVVSASFVGLVAFSAPATAATIEIDAYNYSTAAAAPPDGTGNVTISVTNNELGSRDVDLAIDANHDGSINETTEYVDTVTVGGGETVKYSFDPSKYNSSEGRYFVYAKLSTETTYHHPTEIEIDGTSPEVRIYETKVSDRNVTVSVSADDALDTYEHLESLEVNISGPDNVTLTLDNFTNIDAEPAPENWTATHQVSADGRYNITVVNATDRAGNKLAVQQSTEVIVDTEKPEVWNGSSYDATNENGVVNDSDEVVVTANVTDEFLRDVWVNASAFGAGNVSLTKVSGTNNFYRGNFTVNTSNTTAPDGLHELVVWADDAGPNYNSTSAGNLTLDTTEPTFANRTPAPNAYVNDSDRNVTVDIDDLTTLSGYVTINASGETVVDGTFENATGVHLTADQTLVVNTSKAVAAGEFPEGPVNVTVTASDVENHTNTTEWSFVVDTIAPNITDTQVVDEDDGDGIVNDGQNVTVYANVTDPHLINDSVTADVSPLGPSALDMTRVSGTDRFSATFTVNTTKSVDNETFAFEVSAEDKANNTNTTTAGTVTLDTLAPRVTNTEPDVRFTNDTQTNLSASLNESHLGEVEVLVNASTGTLVNQTVSPSDPTSANVTLSGSNATGWHVEVEPGTLPDGNVTGTFTAHDVDGNVTETNVSFVVDTHLPAFENVTITDVNNGNGYVADGNAVNVSFTLDEQYPDSAWIDSLGFGAGAKNVSGQSEPYTWTFNTTFQPGDDGQRYDALLNATDLTGNYNETTTANLTVDLTAPTFANATPSGDVIGTATPNVTVDVRNERNALDVENVTATFTDSTGSTTTVDVAGSNDGVTFEQWNNTTNGTLVVNTSAANLSFADGDVNATVTAADVDGNTNSTSFGFVVDTTAPVFTNVSLADADGDGVVNGGDTVRVTATLDEPHPDTVWANASAFGVDRVNLTQVSGAPTPTFEGNFTVNGSAMAADGPHDVAITAVDTENNTNRTTTANLTIDSTGPAVSDVRLIDATDGNNYVTDGHEVTINATVTDAHDVTVTAGASAFGVGTVTLNRTTGDYYETTFTVNVSENVTSTQRVTVAAEDTTGNIGNNTSTSLVLDTAEPGATDGATAGAINLSNQNAYPVTVDLPAHDQNLTVSVRLAINGSNVTKSTEVSATAENVTLTLDASTLSDGAVDIATKVVDPAGNVNPGGWTYRSTVTKDTVRPTATSAHTTAGASEVYLAVSEQITDRNYSVTDVEETLSQNVTDVALRGGDLLVVTLDAPITSSQLSNPDVTMALDEDVVDLAGNHAPATGANVTLTEGATAIHSVDAEVRATTVTVSFNGPVYAGDGGNLTKANFSYTDVDGAGAGHITGVSHTAGDTVATLTLENAVTTGDLGTDEISIGPEDVFNGANQSIGAQTVTLVDTRAPTLGDYAVTSTKKDVVVTFSSTEPLQKIVAEIGRAYGASATTLTTADFTEHVDNGTYYYRATATADQDGRYVGTLTTARDFGGNSPPLPLRDTTDVDTHDPQLTLANISDVGVRDGQVYTNVTLTLDEPVEFRNLTTSDISFTGVNATVTNVTHNTLGGNETVGDTITVTVAGELDTEDAPSVTLSDSDLYEATGDRVQVATQSTTVYTLVRTLGTGHNFVSFPIESGSVPVTSLDLSGVDVVWTYESGTWKSYDPDAPTNSLDRIRGGQGYIFVMDRPNTMKLTLDNAAASANHDSVTLEPGWNLVGHWQESGQNVSRALSSAENVTAVRAYTGPVLQYESLAGTDRFTPGDAYWVYVNRTTSQTYTVAPYTNSTGGV